MMVFQAKIDNTIWHLCAEMLSGLIVLLHIKLPLTSLSLYYQQYLIARRYIVEYGT